MRTQQKGFTLVELLIVIAIIGLLATLAIVSLTAAQQRARDTKRVADLKALQTSMELYWNENANYPALAAAGTNTWAELSTTLSTFIGSLPKPPQDPNPNEVYTYVLDGTTTDEYYLGTTMENAGHQALTQDIDGTVGGAGFVSLTSADAFDDTAATLDCADPVYCLYSTAED